MSVPVASIIEDVRMRGQTIDPLEVVNSYNSDDYYPWLTEAHNLESTNFWDAFYRDLYKAKESVFIMSPRIDADRSLQLAPLFEVLVKRSIAITVYTLPPKEQRRNDVNKASTVLTKSGVRVVQRTRVQHRVALIDDEIVWSGELDILHKDDVVPMLRHHGQNATRSIKRYLGISSQDTPGDITKNTCPNCSKSLIVRKGRNGNFLGCSSYPRCRHTQRLAR